MNDNGCFTTFSSNIGHIQEVWLFECRYGMHFGVYVRGDVYVCEIHVCLFFYIIIDHDCF